MVDQLASQKVYLYQLLDQIRSHTVSQVLLAKKPAICLYVVQSCPRWSDMSHWLILGKRAPQSILHYPTKAKFDLLRLKSQTPPAYCKHYWGFPQQSDSCIHSLHLDEWLRPDQPRPFGKKIDLVFWFFFPLYRLWSLSGIGKTNCFTTLSKLSHGNCDKEPYLKLLTHWPFNLLTLFCLSFLPDLTKFFA